MLRCWAATGLAAATCYPACPPLSALPMPLVLCSHPCVDVCVHAPSEVAIGAVGLPSPSTYERCHVNQLNGTVDRLLSGWSVQARRPFGIDMAGFAFSTSLLADPKIQFAKDSEKGFLEHDFLKRLVDGKLDKLEPIGGNCTRILTWHVRTSVGMPGRQYKSPEVHGSGNSTLLMQLV